MVDEFIEVFSLEDFRKWLLKNNNKKKRIGLIIHKKKTGKKSPSHKDLMLEAICFGWIDTTLKSIDENRYVRFFCQRNKNSKWSYNTLSYAEKLIQEGKMRPEGIKFYEEGKNKLPHDHGIPLNPVPWKELIIELKKNDTFESFEKLSPSLKKNHLRWILRAKRDDTKNKRIELLIKELKKF